MKRYSHTFQQQTSKDISDEQIIDLTIQFLNKKGYTLFGKPRIKVVKNYFLDLEFKVCRIRGIYLGKKKCLNMSFYLPEIIHAFY